MTVVILISLVAGGMVGYFIVPLDFLAGVERVSMLALYMLLFLVGVEIGHNKSAFKNIKNMGKKIIAVTSSIVLAAYWVGL